MKSYQLPSYGGRSMQSFANPLYKNKYYKGGDGSYFERVGTSFVDRDSDYMKDFVRAEDSFVDQELSDLYYNMGLTANPTGRVKSGWMDKPTYGRQYDSKELISIGRGLSGSKGARALAQMNDYQGRIDRVAKAAARGDYGNWGSKYGARKASANMSSNARMVGSYRPAATAYQSYQTNYDKIMSGGNIERKLIASDKTSQPNTQKETTEPQSDTQDTKGSSYQSGSVFGGRRLMPSYWRKRVARQRNVKF